MKMKSILVLAALIVAVVLLRLIWSGGPMLGEAPVPEPQAIASAPRVHSGAEHASGTGSGDRDEPMSESLEAMTIATAEITRGDQSLIELKAIDSEFPRISVEPNEVLRIRLVLMNRDASQPVMVEADNGGSLNHRLGPLVCSPGAQDDAVEFQFAVGVHRGSYTVLVTQGRRQEMLEFYVGPEQAVGQAGPLRVFNPDNI